MAVKEEGFKTVHGKNKFWTVWSKHEQKWRVEKRLRKQRKQLWSMLHKGQQYNVCPDMSCHQHIILTSETNPLHNNVMLSQCILSLVLNIVTFWTEKKLWQNTAAYKSNRWLWWFIKSQFDMDKAISILTYFQQCHSIDQPFAYQRTSFNVTERLFISWLGQDQNFKTK